MVIALIVLVVIAMQSYCLTRLRLGLLALLHDDLVQFVDRRASFSEGEYERIANTIISVGARFDGFEESELERDEEQTTKAVQALVGESPMDYLNTPEFAESVSAQHRLAAERLSSRIERVADPVVIARFGTYWVDFEIAGVALHAFRHVGWGTPRFVVAKAGETVTEASVAGLIISILVWGFWSHLSGDFFAYIGGGVTLGAFVGLAVCAISLYARAVSSTWGYRKRQTLVLMIMLLILSQVVFYLGPHVWMPAAGR